MHREQTSIFINATSKHPSKTNISKDTVSITLSQGPMKTSRKQKLHYFPPSIILKTLIIPTTLELVLRYIDWVRLYLIHLTHRN